MAPSPDVAVRGHSQLRVTVLLADSAQADPSGKVHLLGLGWTRTGVPTGPVAVVVLLRLEEPVEAGRPHEVGLELVDAEGKTASFTSSGGSIRLTAKVEPSPDALAELPVVAPVVLQLGGLPLAAGQTYTWRVSVDGQYDEDWTASFTTHGA